MEEFIRVLLVGLIVGLALAAPVGPVGVICIQRAIAQGRWPAVAAGLGAAVADAIFGAIAGLGLVLIQAFIEDYQTTFTLVGVIILLYLGIDTWRKPPVPGEGDASPATMAQDFATTFSLAIVNPATMFAAFGLFAAFGPVDASSRPIAAGLLVGGVFIGSTAWWLFLASITVALRQRVINNLSVVNKGSAGLLFLFAAVLIGGLIGNGS